MAPGAEERIVRADAGPAGRGSAAAIRCAVSSRGRVRRRTSAGSRPATRVRELRAGRKLDDVSFALRPGEVLGLVALEGQGQDELFGVLSGARDRAPASMLLDGRAVAASAIPPTRSARALFVPADRVEALLMQRSVRENIGLPSTSRPRTWGPIDMCAERERVNGAIERLQIDTRAQCEVRRLSGGNQQKVTIARWVAGGIETLLCFDPTRGIDIRTKRQIYQPVRELAAGGCSGPALHVRAGGGPAGL